MKALLIGSSIGTAAAIMAAAEATYKLVNDEKAAQREMHPEPDLPIVTLPVMSRQVTRAQKRKAEKIKARVAAKKSKAEARIEMKARKMVARK